jgi:ribonucleoside-diphosphate reductase alpha chain
MTRLEGLGEKIFLDRYALKHEDASGVKPGDLVLVLVKEDSKFPVKEVGEVTERSGSKVKVKLRNGDTLDSDLTKLSHPLETTPGEMWDRIADAISAVEQTEEKVREWRGKFREMLDGFKLVPGGRIAAGAGTSEELTLFNCYVIPSPKDSRGGIMESLANMTEIMARGGGVGFNLSSLRPRRAVVAGVNGTSSGAVSWGGLFSYTTGLIEQGGSRRGALMLMINDWHPDLLEFITVKQSMGQVTNANLSVCVSNAFMQAVKEDLEWNLVFPDTKDPDYDELWTGDLDAWKALGKEVVLYKTVSAREIWHIIMESAWKSAEPGVVFMEYYNEMSNSWYFNPINSTNPCFHPETRISTEYGLLTIAQLYQKMKGKSFLVGTDARLVEEAKVVGGRSYEVPGLVMRQAKVFSTGMKETIVVALRNGMDICVTKEHRLYTKRGWKEAQYLTPEDYVYVQSGKGKFASKDDLGEQWGVFLGWLTGDGWISKRGDIGMVFGAEDKEAVRILVDAGEEITGVRAKVNDRTNGTQQVYWWRKELLHKLIELGVKAVRAPEKTVPECIFYSSETTVTAFLQALFSADGTVYERDEARRSVRLTSASKKLLQGVQLLLLNYGIHSSIYARPKKSQSHFQYVTNAGELRTYEGRGFYELIMTGNNILVFKEQIGFRYLSRKQEALERIARRSRKTEKFLSAVVSVKHGELVEVYDITEPVTHSLIAGGMVAHNCGEQGLPGWGVCNLSAINLSRFYDEGKQDVDWEELSKVTRWSVRFLDNVIDATPYHFPQNEANQKKERRIGLGTMGLAELLIKLQIRYGSQECLHFLEKLYGFMAREAYLASAELAAEKGAFPVFDAELFVQSGFMKELISHYPEVGEAIMQYGIRNVTVLTQAPTGSTGTMVGTSTGIEPYFAFQYFRQSRLGFDKQFVPIAQQWKDAHPGEELPDYFVTAMDLSAKDHIRVQAAIQRWVDSSISKTANCPNDFTIEETKELYEMAYELGCKGVTIYRDGSRDVQVLSTTEERDTEEREKAGEQELKLEQGQVKEERTGEQQSEGNPAHRVESYGDVTGLSNGANGALQEPTVGGSSAGIGIEQAGGKRTLDKAYKSRPQVLRGATYKINTPFGMAYITINDLSGSPGEIFLNVGKAGSDVFAMAEALGRVCSLFLRYGDHGHKVELLIKHLKGIGGSGSIGFGANRVESIADAVAKALEQHIQFGESGYAEPRPMENFQRSGYMEESEQPLFKASSSLDLCPSCGSASLINIEGCKQCSNCGFSKCN